MGPILRASDQPPFVAPRHGEPLRAVLGEHVQFGFARAPVGTTVPIESHPEEQVLVCLEGALRIVVDGEEVELRAGEVLHVRPNVPHGDAVVLEPFLGVELLSPPPGADAA